MMVFFLSVVAALGVISSTLCAPALPFIADHFSSQIAEVQFTISLFLVGNAFGQFFSGPLSDRVGQKRVLISALLLYVVASFVAALSTSMAVLIGSRFFQGMGSAVGPVLARAIAATKYSQEGSAKVQSYGAMGVGFASVIAILCAGKITLISWRGNFYLAAGLGICLVLWTLCVLKKDQPVKKVKIGELFSEMKQVFIHPDFLKPASCHAIAYGLMYGYIALFPFLLKEMFSIINPFEVALYSALMIGFYMLGSFLASQLMRTFSLDQMIRFGIGCQLFSGCLLLMPIKSFFFGALCLYNIGLGIILPLTASKALFPFVGRFVGAASSSLGLSYRFVGSLLSAGIASFALGTGKNLACAMIVLSVISLFVHSIRKSSIELDIR